MDIKSRNNVHNKFQKANLIAMKFFINIFLNILLYFEIYFIENINMNINPQIYFYWDVMHINTTRQNRKYQYNGNIWKIFCTTVWYWYWCEKYLYFLFSNFSLFCFSYILLTLLIWWYYFVSFNIISFDIIQRFFG